MLVLLTSQTSCFLLSDLIRARSHPTYSSATTTIRWSTLPHLFAHVQCSLLTQQRTGEVPLHRTVHKWFSLSIYHQYSTRLQNQDHEIHSSVKLKKNVFSELLLLDFISCLLQITAPFVCFSARGGVGMGEENLFLFAWLDLMMCPQFMSLRNFFFPEAAEKTG